MPCRLPGINVELLTLLPDGMIYTAVRYRVSLRCQLRVLPLRVMPVGDAGIAVLFQLICGVKVFSLNSVFLKIFRIDANLSVFVVL